VGADLVSCVLYAKAVARLPLRSLGFLVCCGFVAQHIEVMEFELHVILGHFTYNPIFRSVRDSACANLAHAESRTDRNIGLGKVTQYDVY